MFYEPGYSTTGRVQQFLYMVYGLMAAALGLTGATAYAIFVSPSVQLFFLGNPFSVVLLFIVQIGLVIGLSAFIRRMTVATAFLMFVLYAIAVGITLSSLFVVYPIATIYKVFLVCAGMFLAMSIYGYITKTDLSMIGNIGFMVLIGLCFGLIINMFLKSQMADYIMSGVGVILFTLLTAYDTQKLKQMAQQLLSDQEAMNKVVIIGALTLYLDFINLFLFLLRFSSSRQE